MWLAKCELVFLGFCVVSWAGCWLADALLARRNYRRCSSVDDAVSQLLRDDDRRALCQKAQEGLKTVSFLSLALVVAIYTIAVVGLSIR